jgi:DNA-directed RNA polymerase specialized sigma54-like protein
MKKWAHELNRDFSKAEVQNPNKYMQKYSTSLTLKEMQIKTILRFHLTLVEGLSSRAKTTANVGKDAVKQEHLYIVGGNVNLYHHYGKHYGDSLKN